MSRKRSADIDGSFGLANANLPIGPASISTERLSFIDTHADTCCDVSPAADGDPLHSPGLQTEPRQKALLLASIIILIALGNKA